MIVARALAPTRATAAVTPDPARALAKRGSHVTLSLYQEENAHTDDSL